MKTREDIILETINYHVLEAVKTDTEKQKGYGDRIIKAGRLVASSGVKALGHNHYEVASGTESDRTYKVNGNCECQDALNSLQHEQWLKDHVGKDVTSFAPGGYCKHKLSVIIWGKVQARLKWLIDKDVPHTNHRWNCTAHRAVPITCWQHACPDPIDLECPTCSRGLSADPVTGEENPNVPTYLEEIIKEEAVPVDEYITHPDDDTYEGIATPATALDDVGLVPEAVAVSVEPPVTEELPPLVLTTPQYEAAPVVEPTLPPLPEAPVSMCLTLRLPENHQLTYTLRGVTDAEVLERLPNVLATLERLMHTEVDYEGNFVQRLVRAFFPKKTSGYSGK